MLDGQAKGVIAEGRPADLRDGSPDPRVRAFFNRQPGVMTRGRRSEGGDRGK